MSTPPPPTRRIAIAIGAAAASTTIAIGVTAGSLLGWFAPGSSSPADPLPAPQDVAPSSPVILVPVVPEAPQVAMHERDREHDRERERDDDHDRHDDEEAEDDDD